MRGRHTGFLDLGSPESLPHTHREPRCPGWSGWLPALSALVFATLVFAALLDPQAVRGQEPLPVELPEGFSIQLVASDELVHDAFCMTLDPAGRPVISGPAYIRTLVDTDGDGRFDKGIPWTGAIRQGAQGLWAEGKYRFWVADGGLWRSADNNGDLVADTPPEKLLALTTGGEHHAHAIRRGPDGWWYLMAGNHAEGIQRLKSDGDAAIPVARAGTLWRISPDFQRRGVFAHGLRNAYDFDFLPDGQPVTYDSDGERDITLPWYRPTRILVLSPGSDAGWIGECSRDPDYRFLMPRTLASLGRGSPTGVAVYQHSRFPSKYRGAVLALDWTFGRILAVYPEHVAVSADHPEAKQLRLGAETFLKSTGSAGFAATDLVVEPSGSLLVTVGGRGTRGAIYRIDYQGPEETPLSIWRDATNEERNGPPPRSLDTAQAEQAGKLLQLHPALESHQVTFALQLVGERIQEVLAEASVGNWSYQEKRLNDAARLQAARQLLALPGSMVPARTIDRWLVDPVAELRAMGWRAIGWGKTNGTPSDLASWQKKAADLVAQPSGSPGYATDWGEWMTPVDRLAAWECIGWRRWTLDNEPLPLVLSDATTSQVRLWAISRRRIRQGNELLQRLADLHYAIAPSGLEGRVLDGLALEVSQKRWPTDESAMQQLLTHLQAAIGDLRHEVPPQSPTAKNSFFDSYRSRFAERFDPKVRDGWTRWLLASIQQAGSDGKIDLQVEAIRTLAMIRPALAEVPQVALSLIDDKSHPTSDLHALALLASGTHPAPPERSAAVADALLSIERKVKERGLNTDSQWQNRLRDLWDALLAGDPQLPAHLIGHPDFGKSDSLLWARWLPLPLHTEARRKMLERMLDSEPSTWSPEMIRWALESSEDPRRGECLRVAWQEPALRGAVLATLARQTALAEGWQEQLLERLASPDRSGWLDSWNALRTLPSGPPQKEFQSLTEFLVRSGKPPEGIQPTELLERLQRAANALSLPSIPDQLNPQAWLQLLGQAGGESVELQTRLQALQSPGDWRDRVAQAAGQKGDAQRGKLLFQQTRCAQCHNSSTALGPDLAGVSRRFATQDLWESIFEPSKSIPDRYQAYRVLTVDDQVLVGLTIYRSADGILLHLADGQVARVSQEDLSSIQPSSLSLMPSGLLDGLEPQQLADLLRYLETL
jgi:putative heme-binding domain-containing protein